jgi:cyclic pyranopterin phosphate synthase
MAGLTHLDDDGSARMVDVAERDIVVRTATAAGRVLTTQQVLQAISSGATPKGDVAAVGRIAGIMGAKRTPDLIPLCHPIALHGVDVQVTLSADAIELTATTRTADRTGVEMEALTAVAVAGLAVIDMIKALDPSAALTDVRVLSKHGGRTGDWERPMA